ncbi:hypothetical protein KIN20_025457 [Parelaphostrongylus tenuis]|uniref:Uncharacterized protein n=1 Tax=Parelaphostrongylus tenuis TaxID=148309 RepID=A0AAD5NDD4_PARTN|nr:hypothetical protein KIN20_025457 [Parelaphostrongylus tenuis]
MGRANLAISWIARLRPFMGRSLLIAGECWEEGAEVASNDSMEGETKCGAQERKSRTDETKASPCGSNLTEKAV